MTRPTGAAIVGRVVRAAVVLSLVITCAGRPEIATLRLEPGGEGGARVVLSGLSDASLDELRELEPQAETWNRLFNLRTALAADASLPPVAGSYEVIDDEVVFEPAFPFLDGRTYRATWTGAGTRPGEAVELSFTIPERAGSRGRVSAVYPSADALPENLLRLYIHFSVPMSEGQAELNLRLLRDDGSEVEQPYAVPGRELWNRRRDRLTLLFDPGRVKRGVGPNLDVGPPLEVGRSYRLFIDAAWLDARGKPLLEPYEKRFRVVQAQRSGLNPEHWRLTPPTGNDPSLVIEFARGLDHALLTRSLSVWSDHGDRLTGTIEIGSEERSWRFKADESWISGAYTLRIGTALEDPAGNSLRGPFEAGQGAAAGELEATLGETLELPFVIDFVAAPSDTSS